MKIVIPLYDNFTALDVIGPYEVLGKLPGSRTVFAGRERRVYKSDTPTLGIEAEAAFADIDSADVLLVGGTAHVAQVTANPPRSYLPGFRKASRTSDSRNGPEIYNT